MAQADTKHEPPFRGRATIRDIADLAGVSIATVSRVLNDPAAVAPGKREKVPPARRAQRAGLQHEPRRARSLEWPHRDDRPDVAARRRRLLRADAERRVRGALRARH